MKILSAIVALMLGAMGWVSCNTANAKYIDLATGDTITLKQDDKSGQMVNAETGKPVRLYVNTRTRDTIYGPTGKVVNREVIRYDDGAYVYSGDEEYKLKHEKHGYKEKWGDDNKVKMEKNEYKAKYGDDNKKKVEKDGDVVIKRGDRKIKIDGETGERKVK